MSAAVDSNQHTVSARHEAYHSAATASGKTESTEQPRLLSYVPKAEREAFDRMSAKVLHLWKGYVGIAYTEARAAILNKWKESGPDDRNFFETAVILLIKFQRQPMKSMKDCLEWSDYVKKNKINSKRYFLWVQEQYELLARRKRKGFEDISLERLSECLMVADWKDANDESAVVNAYLLTADLSPKPEIYLGTILNWLLALRINGRCLKVPKAELSTVESYGVTAINPDVLLSIRYLLGSDSAAQSFLFIPIGNVFRMGDWSPNLDTMGKYNFHKAPWSQNLEKAGFREANWRITGFVLVLRIMETGVPGGLYLVNDRELSNKEDSEGYEPISLVPDRPGWTLAEVTNACHGDLRPYDGTTENQVVSLKVLSFEKLEIVQSGVKGDWDKGVPPIGLYPVDRTLEVPKGGDTYAGHFVPEKTSISVRPYVINHSDTFFASANAFAPERWLPKEQRPVKFAADHLSASNPFSLGPRSCIGKNLAWAEMRLILARLLWVFDIAEEEDKGLDWESLKTLMIVQKEPLELWIKLREGVVFKD